MTRLHFTKPHNLARLHDELVTAGFTVERCEGEVDDNLWITVSDDADEELLATVVAAHNKASWDAVDLATRDANIAEPSEARQAITNLQAYRDLASPTTAQTIAVTRLLCRVAIILIRRTLR